MNAAADSTPLPVESDLEDTIVERRLTKQQKMSDFLNRIEKLNLDGNIAENWRKFKRNFEIFMRAGELNTKTDDIKINTLLYAVGEEAVEVFDTFGLSDDDSKSYAAVLKSFDRFLFYQRKQKEGEPFDTFLMDIERLVKNCAFTGNENEMLRDQIVMGIHDKKVQLRILETSDLTYEQAVEKGRQGETTKEQTATMNKSADVHEIRSNDKPRAVRATWQPIHNEATATTTTQHTIETVRQAAAPTTGMRVKHTHTAVSRIRGNKIKTRVTMKVTFVNFEIILTNLARNFVPRTVKNANLVQKNTISVLCAN